MHHAEDEEDDIPKVRKRRYKPRKKADDDEDAPSPPSRRGAVENDDEEDEEYSNSTGYVFLDIALDFVDDCIDWAKTHVFYAIIIGTVSFLIVTTLSYLFISSWIRYLNRPTLVAVSNAYHLGLFPETKLLADEALRYVSPHDSETRSAFLFLQGAALCAIAERAVPADRHDYYLTAANYLKESARYDFLRGSVAEGWFLLGKSLFHCGELEQCRKPLEIALETKYPHPKEIYWYLTNAYFWGPSVDFRRAKQYLKRFQEEPTTLEEELVESYLLESMLALQTEGIKAAEEIFEKVPHFEQFAVMRQFVEGQIEFVKARELRQQAIDLETDPNPRILRNLPVAPAPVNPETLIIPEPTNGSPPEAIPTAPAPVLPMDESTLREFMLPAGPPAPITGVFDNSSEVQQRIAAMQARFAENVSDDEIIVLPQQDVRPAPEPPSTQEIVFDPYEHNPILKRIKELREAAAEHYQRAIALFAEVIRLSDSNDPWGRTARLLAGMSYAEMGDSNNAKNHFHSLIEAFPRSSEAAVAGFLIGEYDRTRGDTDAAFRAFGYAFENIRRNPAYTSFWLPKTMIVERCTAMVHSDIDKKKHADTLKLLGILNGVMPPATRVRLKGEAYESWAALLQSQAETTFGEQGNQLARDAESKRRSAGAAFDELAQLLSDTKDFTNLLWRSAENYRLGKDYRRGIIEYKKYSKADPIRRRPELNLRLGEMYFHLDFISEAAYVLEEALRDFPAHNLTPQLRLVLSHVYYEQKEWDKAKALLQLNLIGEASPASASYRDSMFALGNISFEQGDLDAAIAYLEDAVKVHPEAIQSAEAHYTLAQAYLRQAENQLKELVENSPEAVRRTIESIVLTHRQRALTHLTQTENVLSDRQRVIGLSEAEKLMLRNAQFAVCSVLTKMEQYDQAIPKLNALATMYQDRPETLDALVKMAYSQRMTGRETEAQTTLKRAEVLLNQLEKIGTIADGTSWRNVIREQMGR